MSSIFNVKQVPGILTPDARAAGIKQFTDEYRRTAGQQLDSSAFDFAQKVIGDSANDLKRVQLPQGEALMPQPTGHEEASPKRPSAGILGEIGMLEPGSLEQEQEHDTLIRNAVRWVKSEEDAVEFREQAAARFGPPIEPQSEEERKWQLEQQLKRAAERKAPLAEAREYLKDVTATAPTQTWWRNAVDVGMRSAAQTAWGIPQGVVNAWELTNPYAIGTMLAGGDPQESGVSQWMDSVDKSITQMLPGDPARSKEFVSQLASGVGSMAAFMMAGYVGSVFGTPSAIGSSLAGGFATGNAQYEEAQQFSARGLQKYFAFYGGFMLGLTEGIPLEGALRHATVWDRAFFKANNETQGALLRALNNTSATSLEEFIQEFGQAAGQDVIAKYAYDPERELDVINWAQQGVIGGIVGGGVGLSTTVLSETGALQAEQVSQVDPEKQQMIAEAVMQKGQSSLDTIFASDPEGLVDIDVAPEAAPAGSAGPRTATAGEQTAVPQVKAARSRLVAAQVSDPVLDIIERVVSPDFDTASVTQLAQEADAALDGEAARAVADFIGHEYDTKVETGVMSALGLEAIARGENPTAAAQLEAAFAPVREELRQQVGNTVRLYRVQRPTTREENVRVFGMPKDGKRAALSWSSNPEFARAYAGAGKDMKVYSDDEIAAFEKTFAEEGQVKIGRHWLVKEDSQWPVIYPDRDGKPALDDMVTDTDSVRDYIGSENEWAGKHNARNAKKAQRIVTADVPVDDIMWISDRANQSEFIVRNDPARPVYIDETGAAVRTGASPAITSIPLGPHETLPLPDIEKGLEGPIPIVVQAAKAYAAAAGIQHTRARSYVKVDTSRAARIASAYADMKHQPDDPAVQAAYRAMAEETVAQYQFVKATGIVIEPIPDGQPEPYASPREVLADIRRGHIWYFRTEGGFGSDATFDASDNPLLERTNERDAAGNVMLVNDVFRVVHDFFGHGLEGAGFGPRGEENAWQSHMRLYSASAVPAMTSETRGQNSWVNYGPFGEQNRANPKETTYADQKTGIMPSWTWSEGVIDSTVDAMDAPVAAESARFTEAFLAAKAAHERGAAVHAYTAAEYAKMRTFLSPDGLSGFALNGEDIVSVFVHPAAGGRGRLRKIIDTAVANGGRTLDAFDGRLVQMYAALGFREAGRANWDESQKPAGWQDEWGKPDVVFMEYAGADVERMVAAPLFGGNRLEVVASGNRGQPRVRDVAQALQDRHNLLDGGKLFPEDSEADYERVLQMGLADFAAQVGQPNSGIGWYSTDVATAVDLTSRVFPTLATDPAHRDLYLTFAGIFSNGATPEQAWGMSAEAFDMFLAEGAIQSKRGGGKKWGVRDAANVQQIELVRYMVEREGSLEAAMAWFKGQQKRTTINDIMTESGLYKAGRFTTKAEQQGEAFGFLAFGGKLGRYTLGLHGVELEADNTTVDLWYTRTFRRWTGRLFDAPISAEGIAGGVNSEKERETIFRLTGDIQKQYPGLTAGDVQAVLWFFEKRLYAEHGVRTSEGTNSSGARKLLSARGVDAREGSAGASDQGGEDGSVGGFEALAEIERMTGTSAVRAPYKMEPSRPQRGIPAKPDDTPYDENLSSLSRSFAKLLNMTVRQRLTTKQKEVMGEYNRRTSTVRLRSYTDFSTLVHEGGHFLNDAMEAANSTFFTANSKELRRIGVQMYNADLKGAPAETQRREGFAEFMRIYVTARPAAVAQWPQLTKDFEAAVKAFDSRMLDGLDAMSVKFEGWRNQPSTSYARNMIVSGFRRAGLSAAVKEMNEAGVVNWMREVAIRANGAMVNRYAALNSLVDELLNIGEQNRGAPLEIAAEDNPSIIARMAKNVGNRAQQSIRQGVLGYRSLQPMSKGLEDVMLRLHDQPLGRTLKHFDEDRVQDFDAYLAMRRALAEYTRYEAGELTRPPIDASKGEIVQAVKDFESKYGDAFREAAQWTHEYGIALWQLQYDAGLIDKDTYAEGRKRTFYAPLQRDVSDKRHERGESALTSGDRLTRGPRFKGSGRQIVSPLAVLMEKTFTVERMIVENEARRSLAVLADRAGKAGALVERVPATQLIGTSVNVMEAAQKILGEDGPVDPLEAQDMMTMLAATYGREDTFTIFRSQQAASVGQNALFFWENGKMAAIVLKEGEIGRDVVNTLNAVGHENMDVVINALAATSGVFRNAITLWPDFLVMNFLRDQPAAWILTEGYVPVFDAIRGARDEVMQKQLAKDYNAALGTLGGMNNAALHATRVQRDIRTLGKRGYAVQAFGDVNSPWDITGIMRGMSRFTELAETGTRFGVFRRAYDRGIKEGLSAYSAAYEASYIATDLMDFGLNGDQTIAVRRLIPFFNAQIQGLYKMVRTLGADEVSRRRGLRFAMGAYFKDISKLPISAAEQRALRIGRKAWLKMLSLGVISAALHYLFEDDEDYQQVSEYVRATSWVIPMAKFGGKPGEIIAIPKPFELAIFANATERMLEFSGGDPTALDRFKRGLGLTMTPPSEVPLVSLAYELATNTDIFTGAPIVPSHMQGLAPYLQYDRYTSNMARMLAGVTGQSPMVVDHIMGGLFAGGWRDVGRVVDSMDPKRPAAQATDAPILRRVVRDARSGSTAMQDFYAQASARGSVMSRALSSYKTETEAGNDYAANLALGRMTEEEKGYALLFTHFGADEKRLHPMQRNTQVIQLVNAMRREIAGPMSLTDTEIEPVAGDPPERIQLTARQKAEVDDALSDLIARETRNTLIAMKQAGWADREPSPTQPTLDLLYSLAPSVGYELERRWAKAKIYDAQTVFEGWAEARDRLVLDREEADLSDLVAVAGSGL